MSQVRSCKLHGRPSSLSDLFHGVEEEFSDDDVLGLRLFDILILIVLYASFNPDVDYCMTPDLIDRVEFIAIIVPSSGRIRAKNFSASFCRSQIPFMSWRRAALVDSKSTNSRNYYIAGKYRVSAKKSDPKMNMT